MLGRVDASGRLIAADPQLEKLQREAGSAVGQMLALPQIAAVAQLARKLGTTVSRPAVAASNEHDIDLLVTATPERDEIALSLEGWTSRPADGQRLTAIFGGGESPAARKRNEWATDPELRITSLSPDLAVLLGVDASEASGTPLTRIVTLEDDTDGEMPLIRALAARRDFSGQRARSRADDGCVLLFSGEVVTAADGSFAGFRGSAEKQKDAAASGAGSVPGFDQALDKMLRSPIDRIIENAERIVARADGPLRSDYASYGTDIASAARHLSSVLRAMSDDPAETHASVDLAALATEAVIMLESSAEERAIQIHFEPPASLPARGEERAAMQILVNLIGNAIRYSPDGGAIHLSFARDAATASVTVWDTGRGVPEGDEQRIFEKFERAHTNEAGTGLGLAISRRLARSLGGDVTLDSAPGEGARFTLTLPSA